MTESSTHSKASNLRCLLCGSDRSKIQSELSGKQLRSLWRCMGHEFSDEAWGKITEASQITLFACCDCGFEFFDPSLAGGEQFYRELEHAHYFSSTRPEFARTVRFAQDKPIKRVLDVGCGAGAFLDLAKSAGFETFGIELNKAAAAKAAAKGHRVFENLLNQLSERETGGTFDLITLFQVLEHVTDPLQVLRDASGLLQKGGYIAVAVPSAQGVLRISSYDPHQWPPHHITRWRKRDFLHISKAVGMRLVTTGGDVLLGAQIQDHWNLQHRLKADLQGSKTQKEPAMPRIVSFVYRKTGMKFVFPRWGNSIYAIFRKE